MSFGSNYDEIIKSIQNQRCKASVFYHIYLLIKKRIVFNFLDMNFHILQFLTPMCLTIIGGLIGKFLVHMTQLSIVNNIQEFSNEHHFIIPVWHEPYFQKQEINKLFLRLINDFNKFDLKVFKELPNNRKRYKYCDFDTKSICKLNEDSIHSTEIFAHNFDTLKNRNDSYYIQIINNCELDKYLLRTKFLYSYKR